MRQSLTATMLLSAAVGASTASEATPIDLRVALLALPESDSVETTYYAPEFNYSHSGKTDTMDLGWRLEAGLVGRLHELSPRWSLVGGIWAFYGNQEASEFGPEGRDIPGQTGPMEITTLGIDLYLALALQVNPYLDVEVGPFVGLGTAKISDVGVGASGSDSRVEESGSGDYEEAGLSFTVLAHDTSRTFVFGLGLRYLVSYAEADFSFDVGDGQGNSYPNGLKEHVEIRQSGFMPYLTLGMSF